MSYNMVTRSSYLKDTKKIDINKKPLKIIQGFFDNVD